MITQEVGTGLAHEFFCDVYAYGNLNVDKGISIVNSDSPLTTIELKAGDDASITISEDYGSSINSTIITPTLVSSKAFNALSDIRLKTNIKSYKPTNSILDLDVKEYDWISDGKHAIGCIAQDLQKLFPELVHSNADGILSIEENKLVYLLLLELKKLKEQIKGK